MRQGRKLGEKSTQIHFYGAKTCGLGSCMLDNSYNTRVIPCTGACSFKSLLWILFIDLWSSTASFHKSQGLPHLLKKHLCNHNPLQRLLHRFWTPCSSHRTIGHGCTCRRGQPEIFVLLHHLAPGRIHDLWWRPSGTRH
jgi:hypothetical protein